MAVDKQVKILHKAFTTSSSKSNHLVTVLTPRLESPKLYKIDKRNWTTHLRCTEKNVYLPHHYLFSFQDWPQLCAASFRHRNGSGRLHVEVALRGWWSSKSVEWPGLVQVCSLSHSRRHCSLPAVASSCSLFLSLRHLLTLHSLPPRNATALSSKKANALWGCCTAWVGNAVPEVLISANHVTKLKARCAATSKTGAAAALQLAALTLPALPKISNGFQLVLLAHQKSLKNCGASLLLLNINVINWSTCMHQHLCKHAFCGGGCWDEGALCSSALHCLCTQQTF